MRILSLNKARQILQSAYDWYQKKSEDADPQVVKSLEQQMVTLEKSINEGNRDGASTQARSLESFYKSNCKSHFFVQCTEALIALAVALLLAVAVRQMWFELYEIPTGSMRPTYREQDRLAVSKTPFGINIPLTTGHWLFDPEAVKRGEVVTFTTEGIKNLDEDTTFLGVIPYKKRLIKRLIGRPGDSLYFYGGKIYGVDKDGKALDDLLQPAWAQQLEYIPFIHFNGQLLRQQREQIIYQMNQPIGKLRLLSGRELKGQIFDGHSWINDNPNSQKVPHNSLQAYSDFYGIRNFAMARLLTKKQLADLPDVDMAGVGEGVLYLELRHHPSLTYPKPLLWAELPLYASVSALRAIIPLQQEHLDRLMAHMYTARFIVDKGRAVRYSVEERTSPGEAIAFPGVADGKYEFYHGKLQRVGWGAMTSQAEASNLLLSHTPENVQKLFNFGIEMNKAVAPRGSQQLFYPSRYAYFRDGALYLLGAEILSEDEPLLQEFAKSELLRQSSSSQEKPYVAFRDYGPPFKEGAIDSSFIRTFGITVPDGNYLVLGDNHAMSGDSRVFGFIPAANLQGTPSLLMWPFGERWGIPDHISKEWWNPAQVIVWFLALGSLLSWYWYHRRYLHRPIVLKSQASLKEESR
jgi:signal peptidase I